MKFLVMIFTGIGCILVIFLAFWLINILKYKIYSTRILFSPIKAAPFVKNFTVQNPYNVPGQYRKAQLHLHTSNSIDVFKKEPVPQTIKKYQNAGYSFVVITDHDTITEFSDLNDISFLVIRGMEKTAPYPFWPMGKHLIKIGGENGLIMPAHTNWRGNLGTGLWYIDDLDRLGNFRLIEIFNHHSESKADLQLWHKILERRGYHSPVWGVAVDDSDNGEFLDRGWIMVKTVDVTADSYFNALQQGNFYATTGPYAEFAVEGDLLKVTTDPINRLSFINNQNRIIGTQQGTSAYKFTGDEGFIRVEIQSPSGKTAWSQPFYVIPENR